MRWYDRVFLGIAGLLLLCMAVIFGGIGFYWIPEQVWPALFSFFYGVLQARMTILAVAVVFLLLALRFFILLFEREKPPNGVLQVNDWGTLAITREALDHLIDQAARQVKGVTDTVIKAQPVETGELNIQIKLMVDGEREFPSLVKEVQSSVKKNIEGVAGVPIHEIDVVISKVSPPSLRPSPVAPKSRVK